VFVLRLVVMAAMLSPSIGLPRSATISGLPIRIGCLKSSRATFQYASIRSWADVHIAGGGDHNRIPDGIGSSDNTMRLHISVLGIEDK
jgi:hypothetical protein